MNLIPLSSHTGVEVSGVDLRNLDREGINNIRSALLKNKILVFKNQFLENHEYVEFAKKLGNIAKYPFSSGIDGFPEIVQIKKTPEQTKNFSEMWHVDSTYLDTPPDFTMLSAEVTPKIGGDTVFSNSSLAFESLSGIYKDILSRLDCLFVSDLYSQDRSKHLTNHAQKQRFEATHPAIKIHPSTKSRSIYINQEHSHSFAGMTREESLPIISFLTDYIKRSEFTLRLRWEAGMVAVWDNRSVQHHAVNDYQGVLRIMNRITLLDHAHSEVEMVSSD